MRRFYAVSGPCEEYDFAKISLVLDMIISECISMRERSLLDALEAELEVEAHNADQE